MIIPVYNQETKRLDPVLYVPEMETAAITANEAEFKIHDSFKNSELFEEVNISDINCGTGDVKIELKCSDQVFNDIVNELLGGNIEEKSSFKEGYKIISFYKKCQ